MWVKAVTGNRTQMHERGTDAMHALQQWGTACTVCYIFLQARKKTQLTMLLVESELSVETFAKENIEPTCA